MNRIGRMTQAAIATLMDGNALAAVNDLDRACPCSEIDLLANEVDVRNRRKSR
ncbi:hypothetical protein [Mesorhizobium sp.]|uniref:hypothetical protein n=1 Tax=Mesorhizobium sp. TaxID=1871066 RepID=UPI00257B3EDC|nr:hypothetical protein [Mesorhizobium sp.]